MWLFDASCSQEVKNRLLFIGRYGDARNSARYRQCAKNQVLDKAIFSNRPRENDGIFLFKQPKIPRKDHPNMIDENIEREF